MCRYSGHCSCVWFLLWGLWCMPVDFFARILPVPFLTSRNCGFCQQACDILNQAGNEMSYDETYGNKVHLAYWQEPAGFTALENQGAFLGTEIATARSPLATVIWEFLVCRALPFCFFALPACSCASSFLPANNTYRMRDRAGLRSAERLCWALRGSRAFGTNARGTLC